MAVPGDREVGTLPDQWNAPHGQDTTIEWYGDVNANHPDPNGPWVADAQTGRRPVPDNLSSRHRSLLGVQVHPTVPPLLPLPWATAC